MLDRCQIRRRGAGETVDDNTGEVIPVYEDIYGFGYPGDPGDGKCKVQQRATGAARPQTPGEDHQLLIALELHLPISAPQVLVGDEVTIIAAGLDPQLAGQVFLIRDLFAKSFATARRIGITRRTS